MLLFIRVLFSVVVSVLYATLLFVGLVLGVVRREYLFRGKDAFLAEVWRWLE